MGLKWVDVEDIRQGSDFQGMGVIISTKAANVPGGCLVRIFYTAAMAGHPPVVALTSTFVPNCLVTEEGNLEPHDLKMGQLDSGSS